MKGLRWESNPRTMYRLGYISGIAKQLLLTLYYTLMLCSINMLHLRRIENRKELNEKPNVVSGNGP